MAALTEQAGQGKWKDLFDAEDAVESSETAGEAAEVADAHLLRLVRLGKSVVLAHKLKDKGSPILKVRFARLVAAETRTLLPPVTRLDDVSMNAAGCPRAGGIVMADSSA